MNARKTRTSRRITFPFRRASHQWSFAWACASTDLDNEFCCARERVFCEAMAQSVVATLRHGKNHPSLYARNCDHSIVGSNWVNFPGAGWRRRSGHCYNCWNLLSTKLVPQSHSHGWAGNLASWKNRRLFMDKKFTLQNGAPDTTLVGGVCNYRNYLYFINVFGAVSVAATILYLATPDSYHPSERIDSFIGNVCTEMLGIWIGVRFIEWAIRGYDTWAKARLELCGTCVCLKIKYYTQRTHALLGPCAVWTSNTSGAEGD